MQYPKSPLTNPPFFDIINIENLYIKEKEMIDLNFLTVCLGSNYQINWPDKPVSFPPVIPQNYLDANPIINDLFYGDDKKEMDEWLTGLVVLKSNLQLTQIPNSKKAAELVNTFIFNLLPFLIPDIAMEKNPILKLYALEEFDFPYESGYAVVLVYDDGSFIRIT
jgi:hypothetical protein